MKSCKPAWRTGRAGTSPHATAIEQLIGVQEELGELCHAFLKARQGIRGTPEEHAAAMRDAIGDLLNYLANFCNLAGINLTQAASDAWAAIRDRDWIKYPFDGKTR